MRYRNSIDVPVPPAEAFAYVADLGNAAQWDPSLTESTRLDEGPLEVGSSFRVVATMRGEPQTLRYEIAELDPPRRVVVEGEGEKALSRDVVDFEQLGAGAGPLAGGTRVTYDLDLHLKGVRRLAEPFMGNAVRDMGDRALQGLKRVLDARATTGHGVVAALGSAAPGAAGEDGVAHPADGEGGLAGGGVPLG